MTIDIDTLTLGELKQIAALASAFLPPPAPVALETFAATPHPFVGKFVICRCSAAGVHAGELVALDGDKAILKDSRRLWYWKAKSGLALSGVAQHGVANESKVDALNPEIALTGVCEVIPCMEAARDSILNHH